MTVLVLSLAGLAVILAGGIVYACLLMAAASAHAEALACEDNGRVEQKENVHA